MGSGPAEADSIGDFDVFPILTISFLSSLLEIIEITAERENH